MEDISQKLNSIVNNFYQKYQDLNDEITSKRLSTDEWTLKEIIGHLIDSASNNHQRFVRLQIIDELVFPDYAQDNSRWLEIARYNELNFPDIILLWKKYNVLIANIIKEVDRNKLNNYWKLNGDRITLKYMMIDYLGHIKDHLKQFEEVYEVIME